MSGSKAFRGSRRSFKRIDCGVGSSETPLCSLLYFAVAETSTEEGLIPAAFTARMTK